MSRLLILVSLSIALAACATPQQKTACYIIIESSTEHGARNIKQVPCPPGRHGFLSDHEY